MNPKDEIEVPENDLPKAAKLPEQAMPEQSPSALDMDRAPAQSAMATPKPAAPAEAISGQEVPDDDIAEVPKSDMPSHLGGEDLIQEKYGTTGQQAIAALEGAAKGFAGPLATLAETKLLGVAPEDIAGREEANPWISKGAEAVSFVGSMFTGTGEAALISKAAGALAKTEKLGQAAQAAIKLGIEGGLFHLGDNASKMILGQTDPEEPVAALVSGMPAAVLLGGGLGVVGSKAGSKLQELASSKSASKVSQWLADFGGRFEFLNKNRDVVGSATEEAQHLYETMSAATEGGFNLKRKAVETLTSALDPARVTGFVNDLRGSFAKVPKSMQNSELFQSALADWEAKVSSRVDAATGASTAPSAADVFEATDQLKRQFQNWAKYEKRANISDLPFVNAAKGVAANLRSSLENPEVWGDMGKFQAELNKAYSEAQGPLKDFIKSAMSTRFDQATGQSVSEVDPAKINTLLNAAKKGKELVGFKGQKVMDFLEPAKKFIKTVEDLHIAHGVENTLPAVSTSVLDEMLGKELSSGAKMANWLFGAGPGAIGWAGGHAVGTAVGSTIGHPYLGYRAGEHAAPLLAEMGRKPTRWAVAGLLRALSAGEVSGVPEAIHYAERINKGAQQIENGINNVFRLGGKSAFEGSASEAEREALRKYIAEGKFNDEVDSQKNKGSQQPNPMVGPKPAFAKGGEVLAPEPAPMSDKPAKPILAGTDKISRIYPEQAMLLGSAKSRINSYLNQIRPENVQQKLPFDEAMPDKAKEKSYNRALDLANRPLTILNSIKKGTLDVEEVQHFNSLYPELSSTLKKKLTQKVLESQMKNEKPPYKVRQALSLFVGSPLDANLTPQNIQAAQQTFVRNMPPPAPGKKPKSPSKGSTEGLSDVYQQYQTRNQAIEARARRPK